MKVTCPNHNDVTPSLHVYEDGCFCFVCGYRCPVEQVLGAEDIKFIQKEPTNIGEMIEYITSLPKRNIRGLELHYDDQGFYILWPNLHFYKKRLYSGNVRYVGPRGRRPPLFEIPGRSRETCIVVEGELNALSLSISIGDEYPIFSTGSANELTKYTPKYLTYNTIVAIFDKDVPGVVNALKLKAELLRHGKRVQLIACEKDVNQILQEKQREGVQAWWQKEKNLDV